MKQTNLKEHIIKSIIKPLERKEPENRPPYVSIGKPQQQIQKLKNQPHSITSVIKKRAFFAVRVDKVLLERFKGAVRRNGHSFCYLLEGWMQAYLTGEATVLAFMRTATNNNLTDNKCYTIVQNLYFDRYVYRPRRVYRKRACSYVSEVSVEERKYLEELKRQGYVVTDREGNRLV